jgi:hypothetical protein
LNYTQSGTDYSFTIESIQDLFYAYQNASNKVCNILSSSYIIDENNGTNIKVNYKCSINLGYKVSIPFSLTTLGVTSNGIINIASPNVSFNCSCVFPSTLYTPKTVNVSDFVFDGTITVSGVDVLDTVIQDYLNANLNNGKISNVITNFVNKFNIYLVQINNTLINISNVTQFITGLINVVLSFTGLESSILSFLHTDLNNLLTNIDNLENEVTYIYNINPYQLVPKYGTYSSSGGNATIKYPVSGSPILTLASENYNIPSFPLTQSGYSLASSLYSRVSGFSCDSDKNFSLNYGTTTTSNNAYSVIDNNVYNCFKEERMGTEGGLTCYIPSLSKSCVYSYEPSCKC